MYPEVLITQRQSRVGGSYNSMWVFPGGHVDPGESVRGQLGGEQGDGEGETTREKGGGSIAL